jgi:hypothetical protein
MEVHALQPRINDIGAAHASLTRQLAELTTAMGSRNDVPADVKASVEALSKEVAALAPRLGQPQGGRGGGGGGRGANESLAVRLGQARNGLTAGISPGEQTVRAYTEVKSQTPKAIADINAVIAKASTLGTTLATYNLTLTAPPPVKPLETAPARKAAGAAR